jgi:hypothetical protein
VLAKASLVGANMVHGVPPLKPSKLGKPAQHESDGKRQALRPSTGALLRYMLHFNWGEENFSAAASCADTCIASCALPINQLCLRMMHVPFGVAHASVNGCKQIILPANTGWCYLRSLHIQVNAR